MTGRQRRAVAGISWRAGIVLLLTKVASDVGGLLAGGDRAYTGPSYDLLREIPGGMRVYGVLLVLLFAATVWALVRRPSPAERMLRACLALLAGWYVGWLLAIVGAWVRAWSVASWGTVGGLVVIAALAVLVARVVPPAPHRGG